MRQMGVVVKRQAVGVERKHGFEGGFDAFERLVRQAVNQIHTHRFEARFARSLNHFARFFNGLHAVDRFLHFRVEVLNAHAHAVKTQPAQMQHGFAADFARVDFYRIFAAGNQIEIAPYHRKNALKLPVAQKRGCAAAEVQLRQLMAAV